MDSKKIMAVFAVLVMALGCLTCVAATSDNDASAVLEDQGTVTLDASKDFESNANELKKLGINDASKWIKENNKTTFVLDNVNYRTNVSYALFVTGTCDTLNIIVKGDNVIACGNNKERSEYVDAVLVNKGIGKTQISGNGNLAIICNGTITGNGGTALYVVNDLEISGCKLVAVGPTINDTENEKSYYKSRGISLKDGNLTVDNGAKVIARGGDISAVGESWYDGTKQGTTSIGVFVSNTNGGHNLKMDNAMLYTFGGDVESQAPGFYTEQEKNLKVDVASRGLYVSGNIDLNNNSTLRGYGGDATGNKSTTESQYKYVSSEGMKFYGNITAVDSEIFMVGGKAVSSELAISAGMRHYAILGDTGDAKNITISLDCTDLYAFGGSYTGVDKNRTSGSRGLFATEVGTKASGFDLSISLKQSVANFVGQEGATNSNGIRIASSDGTEEGVQVKGTITVDDSDFYAFGNSYAILASKVQANGSGYACKASTKYYDAGDPVNPSDLTVVKNGYKTCALCYHYNLYVVSYDSMYSPILAYMSDTAKHELPEYDLDYTPDGKKFKCWMIDGKEMQPGEVIDMTHGPVFAVAVWEDDNGSGSGDNNIWLWVALIVVVIIVLALIIIIALRHSSDKKPKAKPVAKKATKSKAKKKTSRKAAAVSEEETTVSKPKAKKAPAKKASAKSSAKSRTVAKKTASKPKTTARKTKTKRTSKR